MKSTVFVLISIDSFAQKPTIPKFQTSDRYDQDDVFRVNPSMKGIPFLDTFKFNKSLEFIDLESKGDQKFISDTLKRFVLNYFQKRRSSYESSSPCMIIPLKSGAKIIFPKDTVKDRRFFLVISPYYYFVIRGSLLWLYYKKDTNGNILGRNDGFRIEVNPVVVIKELLFNKKIVEKGKS